MARTNTTALVAAGDDWRRHAGDRNHEVSLLATGGRMAACSPPRARLGSTSFCGDGGDVLIDGEREAAVDLARASRSTACAGR